MKSPVRVDPVRGIMLNVKYVLPVDVKEVDE
jgi:hypothetical protein